MMDSLTFDREWQRVAVDEAPIPSDQLADILRTVHRQEVRTLFVEAIASGVDVSNLVRKLEEGGAINPLWRMYRPELS